MPANATSFEPGNFAALKHGSRSPRVQRSKQREIRAKVRRELKAKSSAWLDRMILALEARVQTYHDYLDGVGGPVDSRGTVRRCLEHCQKDEAALVRLYDRRDGRSSESDDPLAVALREHWRRQALGRTEP